MVRSPFADCSSLLLKAQPLSQTASSLWSSITSLHGAALLARVVVLCDRQRRPIQGRYTTPSSLILPALKVSGHPPPGIVVQSGREFAWRVVGLYVIQERRVENRAYTCHRRSRLHREQLRPFTHLTLS